MSVRSFDVSWRAIGNVLIALALVWAWLQLWQFVMVIAVAIVMAVALDPAVKKLGERGVPRGVGAFGFVLLLAAIIAGMIAASWVSVSEQAGLIVQNFQNFHQELMSLAVSALLAATVSMTALIGVIVVYVAFNALESYFIAPRVYGPTSLKCRSLPC